MRLFVAVAVPVGAADELDDAVAPLRQSCPGLRWTVRDAWHLTLAFLGEVTEPAWARLGFTRQSLHAGTWATCPTQTPRRLPARRSVPMPTLPWPGGWLWWAWTAL